MGKVIHGSVSVGGLLTWDNRDLRRMVKAFTFDGKCAQDVRDLRSKLVTLLEERTRYLPVGEPCEGWTGWDGCPGHEQ